MENLQRYCYRKEAQSDKKIKKSHALRYLSCPNCNEPNKKENKFCSCCKMVLSYSSYSETIHQEKLDEENEISK
ncbi:MAG: hypothetical protein ACTHKF_07545 [Candidatus Nitrosocosmicus sp.]